MTAADRAVPADQRPPSARRPRPSRRDARRVGERRAPTRRAASCSVRPTSTAWPSTTPRRRGRRGCRSRSTGGSGPASAACAAIGAARSGARRRARARRPAAAPRRRRRRRRRHDVDQRHPAGGHRAGLVQHDGVDPPGRLQHLRALDQDARAARRGRCRPAARSAWPGPSAHGQAMISTATAAVKAAVADRADRRSQATSVSSGERDDDRDEDRRRPGRPAAAPSALPLWASSTSRAIWASWVSAPTRVARTTSRPPTLTVAPTTSSPGPTSTGTDSPVSIDASTADVPATTTPSVAIFSPGRTTKRSPTASWSIGNACLGRRRAAPRRPWRPCRAAPAAPRRTVAWRAPRSSARRG